MNFFSIIVPIYNIENYLPKCIESIINQNFNDYELILVDDGSTDNSKDICYIYKENYKNIKYFYKKNGGLSDARNFGIDKSNGKYLIFLDGDDFLVDGSLIKMYEILNNDGVEMLGTGSNIYYEKKNIYLEKEFIFDNEIIKNYNSVEFLKYIFNSNRNIIWSAWRWIIKKDLINKYNLRFDKKVIGAEDCDWFLECALKTNSVKITDYKLVNYRINREGSITTSIKRNAIIGQFDVFLKWYKYFKENIKEDNYLCSFMANKYMNVLSIIYKLKEEDIDDVIKYIDNEDLHNIIRDSKGFKYKVATSSINIFGIRRTCKLLCLKNY